MTLDLKKKSLSGTSNLSQEGFRENREWIPLGANIQKIIEGEIERERLEAADKFMKLQQDQIESRKKTFGRLSVDMPLPLISKEEYLRDFIPVEAWLYSQFGALLDTVNDRTMISMDGMDIIKKLKIDKMTLFEINGAPRTVKEDLVTKIEEKFGKPETRPERTEEKRQEITQKKIEERQRQDVLYERRLAFKKQQRQKKRERNKRIMIWIGAIGGPILLLALTVYVILKKVS